MISTIVEWMRSIAMSIPADVWIWGSIALTILGRLTGFKWTAWLNTLLGLVALYGFLFCIAWFFPIWLQNVTVIATIVIFIALLCRR